MFWHISINKSLLLPHHVDNHCCDVKKQEFIGRMCQVVLGCDRHKEKKKALRAMLNGICCRPLSSSPMLDRLPFFLSDTLCGKPGQALFVSITGTAPRNERLTTSHTFGLTARFLKLSPNTSPTVTTCRAVRNNMGKRDTARQVRDSGFLSSIRAQQKIKKEKGGSARWKERLVLPGHLLLNMGSLRHNNKETSTCRRIPYLVINCPGPHREPKGVNLPVVCGQAFRYWPR